MPDPRARLAFAGARGEGRWCQRSVAGEVTLFVEEDEIVVRVESNGEELPVSLAALGGASWRAGVLTLHLADDALQLHNAEGLDRAWHAVTLRACTLPEVARGLRALGTLRGRWADAHARFFAPLLQARRRLEGDEPMDWKVAGFDAVTLAERVRGTLAAIALERYGARPPYRRALEAGLLDASDPLIRQLDRVTDAARGVHEGEDARRFAAWRAWAAELRLLFIQADRSWSAISVVLAEDDGALPAFRP